MKRRRLFYKLRDNYTSAVGAGATASCGLWPARCCNFPCPRRGPHLELVRRPAPCAPSCLAVEVPLFDGLQAVALCLEHMQEYYNCAKERCSGEEVISTESRLIKEDGCRERNDVVRDLVEEHCQ